LSERTLILEKKGKRLLAFRGKENAFHCNDQNDRFFIRRKLDFQEKNRCSGKPVAVRVVALLHGLRALYRKNPGLLAHWKLV
jgi:hypothetical protein